MNAPLDPSLLKFGIGQPVPRKEDPVLLRGEGRFTDDLALPGQAHAAVVRSPYAHGVLNGIDTGEAAAMPGVLAILTGRDLEAAGLGPMPVSVARRTGTAARRACRPSR
jgi:carbon-monoxide dehydrogenase large subunit